MFLTSAPPKDEEKRTSAHGSKFIWGVYLAQVGDPSRGRGRAPFKHPVVVLKKYGFLCDHTGGNCVISVDL